MLLWHYAQQLKIRNKELTLNMSLDEESETDKCTQNGPQQHSTTICLKIEENQDKNLLPIAKNHQCKWHR